MSTAESIVCALAITSILPLAHPGAKEIATPPSLPVPSATANPHRPSPRGLSSMRRLPLPEPLSAAVTAINLHADLHSFMLPDGVPADMYSLEDSSSGDVVFVVLESSTNNCPRSGTHKSPRREIWLSRTEITLRCFSHSCRQTSPSNQRRNVLDSKSWYEFANYCGLDPHTQTPCEDNSAVYLSVLLATHLQFFSCIVKGK